MVKTYQKYEHSQAFGVVSSAISNITWTTDPSRGPGDRATGGGRVYTGANEEVLCWDVKKGELLSRWRDRNCSAQVTAIAQSSTDPDIFAVGYSDGSIRLWDARIAVVITSFNGHRSAVTVLTFDHAGVRLASGAKDTDIVLWDLVAEVGLFKFRGHKDQITGIHFVQPSTDTSEGNGIEPTADTYLLSTSKDAIIKLWDVTSQFCIETHVTQSNGDCWALGISPDGSYCLTAGNDGELRAWQLDNSSLFEQSHLLEREAGRQFLTEWGTISRQSGRDRTIAIHFHPKADYVAIHGVEKAVEVWRVRTPSEVQKHIARRRKRKREKLSNADANGGPPIREEAEDVEALESAATIVDTLAAHTIVRTGGKVKSVDWATGSASKALQLVLATTNNQIELYTVDTKEKTKKRPRSDELAGYDRQFAVDLPGHRTDVRALSLSSDDRMLATASSGNLKIWNIRTENCIRTLECGYALCSAFLPGDKLVLVGNKNGALELFDIVASSLVDTIEAHQGAIWAMKVHPNGRSVATGSADKTVKFWDFEIVQEEIPGTRRTTPRLKLSHKRTLKLNDDVLSLCFSPSDDGRLLAVSTLDTTVKVFLTESLKLFLTLYGHKLPVLNTTISSDSKIIATCSADKTVRIWGLDFGDCHKSFLAHEDSVMSVVFPPHPISKEDTNLLFSASKDGTLKTFDAAKFAHVQTLRGHAGEVWALALSRTADFAVSASHDRSIRVWRLSDEPLFLDEERERELDDAHDATLTAQLDHDEQTRLAIADQDGANADGTVAPATKQTSATLTAGERIVEALTICTEDLKAVRAHEAALTANPGVSRAPPQRHPLLTLRNISAERHLLGVLEAVPAAALEDALLLLPFTVVPSLLSFATLWLQRSMNVPLTCRVALFLLRLHYKQVIASGKGGEGIIGAEGGLRSMLLELQSCLADTLTLEKQVMGFNLAACKVLARRIGDTNIASLEDVEMQPERSGKKRGFVSIA